jgi:hypothetical protein
MISAAEALTGHEDALFIRSKGPAEVLLPMWLWRFSGVISEGAARLPFTLAALLGIVTMYLLGERLHSRRVGWLAAAVFALNGFMVAFGRIVQYQSLVVWFSAAAFLLVWQWQQRGQQRAALLGGLFLGAGLLAHYDTVLVLPAIGWLLLAGAMSAAGPALTAAGLFGGGLLVTALPFYLPFALDPQAGRTGDYVGGRVGSQLRNNLPDFFHYTDFYSSFYYLLLSGLLVTAALIWLTWPGGRRWRVVAGVALIGVGVVIFAPAALSLPDSRWDFSFVPFALLLFTAWAVQFRSPTRDQTPAWQAALVWLAVPFLGYNFVVALGLTHIYTTVPAWALLAALGWVALEHIGNLFFAPRGSPPAGTQVNRLVADGLLLALFSLASLFLWNAFVQHRVAYYQDYPAGNLPVFWSPYRSPPAAGLFGFVHRAGWKATGQKIADGTLSGDYGSNEEPDVTTWYTRGAPRACDPQPEFYFIAGHLVDLTPVPDELIATAYDTIGTIPQATTGQMEILQQLPTTLALGNLDDAALSAGFNATARPEAFARSARGAQPADANFANMVRLIGYTLDTRRAYPGGRVPVTLVWQALSPIDSSYQVFTHLATDSGPAAQADGVPVCWTLPTDVWRPGQIIADQRAIILPPEMATGEYPLEVGLYHPETFQRLDLLDEAGNPAAASVILTQITIKDAPGR